MILVVNDACLLIDLIDIDLFDEFLQVGFKAYVTSSVLNELVGAYMAFSSVLAVSFVPKLGAKRKTPGYQIKKPLNFNGLKSVWWR